MRWRRTRGLPVHRLPGGKIGTVYALRSELDDWARNCPEELDAQPGQGDEHQVSLPLSADAQPASKRLKTTLSIGVVAAVSAAAVVAAMVWLAPNTEQAPALPEQALNIELYLQARDDWAKRTPQSLADAVQALETLNRREPRFAEGYAALADTHLLSREFGAAPDAEAFPRARDAALAAIRLKPGLASGHRALGFVNYWWDNDPQAAGRAFKRALELEPNSAQTHFWYGNILSDNGQHPAALAELNRARLLDPGSLAIRADLAWAQWSAGDEVQSVKALQEIAASNAGFPVAHDCLAIVALSRRDWAGYVRHYRNYAAARSDAKLQTRADQLEAALKTGPQAVSATVLAQARLQAEQEGGRGRAWYAFVASVARDRASILEALHRADAADETWGSAWVVPRIKAAWPQDQEIQKLVDRRRPVSAA
ncbi:hypothetical protein LTR94_024752 [Friedmanniomyces endolithicus]|nr:hypothetical protein LTR94_024752 [Friedmanniomyces endolithicus]